jgi:aspartokinase/homoserine dehydrogenase 1
LILLKFGGSSLADEKCISHVAKIIIETSKKDAVCVVLSAMKGVTDSLITCARNAEKGDNHYRDQYLKIKQKHIDALSSLVTGENRKKALNSMEDMFKDLSDILHGIQLIQECSLRSMDLVMSFGERLSCLLMSCFLNDKGFPAEMVDAREIIVTDASHGAALVLPVTNEKIRMRVSKIKGIPVITGFIASTEENVTTTLGRNGSDYTASLVGASLEAERIEIWTDVDGVMSADPRSVPGAFVIPYLSFQEAMELSFFGAEVIHPYTMIPAVESGIPIVIKNSFNPGSPGTIIEKNMEEHTTSITGIASIDDVAIINVEGGGMIGIHGIAARIFGAIARANANIIMISQASSEHSICFVIKKAECEKAIVFLKKELSRELETKRISDFEIMPNLVVVSIIGENMRGTPGIAGKLFSCLGREGINVLSIAQGSSERNLSFVIANKDKQGALMAIHRTFLEDKK